MPLDPRQKAEREAAELDRVTGLAEARWQAGRRPTPPASRVVVAVALLDDGSRRYEFADGLDAHQQGSVLALLFDGMAADLGAVEAPT